MLDIVLCFKTSSPSTMIATIVACATISMSSCRKSQSNTVMLAIFQLMFLVISFLVSKVIKFLQSKQKLHILQVEGSKIAKKINNNHPSFIYADMYQSLDKFELGFQAKTVHNIRGYVVVRRSEQEMRSMRYRMAQGTDGTDETAFF